MKLLIFPGGGNPAHESQAKVYDLLSERAKDFGYSSVDTSVRWPGHFCPTSPAGSDLTFQGAVNMAIAKLAEIEQQDEAYDILARSFGTYVALKAVTKINVQKLRRVVLWGPPPFWLFWELFVRDLPTSKADSESKGFLIDESPFPSLEPFESLLLQETQNKVIVATGTEDIYSKPAFLAYLYRTYARG